MAGATIPVRPGAAAPIRRLTREGRLTRRILVAITILFMGLFVVAPVVNVFVNAFSRGARAYVQTFSAPDVKDPQSLPRKERAAYHRDKAQAEKTWQSIRMTLGVAAIVVPLNIVFGVAAAWAVTKFRFRGKSLLVSLIDLPFSVSPVVSGLVFVLLFGLQGFLEKSDVHWLRPSNWTLWFPTWRGFDGGGWPLAWEQARGVIFTPLAIVLASIFVTFPFVARSLIPLMDAQGAEAEQAALSLGAGGWCTFRRVTLPGIKWGLLYGAILCAARAMGEFGAVSVVSGHLDSISTMPLRIEKLWNEYNTQAAFSVASLLTGLALVTLALKTLIEWKTRREARVEADQPGGHAA